MPNKINAKELLLETKIREILALVDVPSTDVNIKAVNSVVLLLKMNEAIRNPFRKFMDHDDEPSL